MSRPKILQLCTDFPPGGIQRHVLDIAAWLRERDWEVGFAGARGGWMNEEIDSEFHHLALDDVAVQGGRLPKRMVAAQREARRLRSILKSEQFDLVHAHETAPALVARLATIGMKTPIALTFHGAEPERVKEFGMIAKRCADYVLTPSRNSADELSRASGIPRDKIRATGLGVHKPPAMKDSEIAALRDQLLAGGDTLVISIARLAHQKAIDHLIAVAFRIHKEFPGARFVVVGDGPQKAEVERWISDAGLNGVVILAGRTNTPHIYLAAADIFFLPSRWESLPISIVEAFRAGLPVIATDTGGVSELVDGTVGHACKVGDIDALTMHLGELVGDCSKRSARAATALERSREDRFDPDAVNQKMADAYEYMIARTNQSAAQ